MKNQNNHKNAPLFTRVIKRKEFSFGNEPILINLSELKKDTSMKVNLYKEGNIIRTIEVICSCGNRINIVCEYENEKRNHANEKSNN